MSPRAASSSRSWGSSTRAMPGVFGPKMIAGDHEERDRRQADAPAEPGEEPGGEERAAERDEVSPTRQLRRRGARKPQVLLAADDDEAIAGLEHLGRLGRDDRLTWSRRIAATVILVRRRISSSAIDLAGARRARVRA